MLHSGRCSPLPRRNFSLKYQYLHHIQTETVLCLIYHTTAASYCHESCSPDTNLTGRSHRPPVHAGLHTIIWMIQVDCTWCHHGLCIVDGCRGATDCV
ncbi:hypothetical protein GDO81_025700 [Engystomops pustulosus]|uniref:Uncharacterized protein n=1 Tax=Engystomops pustulosus TaxID=76066 RepID=A0AAV6YNM2_ENGPU|nr:hypothetical protein GDO81_025700 [Engystomops pustulosus]